MARNTIEITIRATDSGAQDLLRRLERLLQGTERQAEQTGRRLSWLGRVGETALGFLGGTVATRAIDFFIRSGRSVVQTMIQENVEAQSLEKRFTALLGAQELAARMMDMLAEHARKVPFAVDTINESAARLTAVGMDWRRILPIAEQLTAALGEGDESLQGWVQTFEQLNSPRGPEALLNRMARSMPALAREISEGLRFDKNGQLVSSAEEVLSRVETVFRRRNFGKILEEQTRSLPGQIRKLRDHWEEFLEIAGGPLFRAIATGLDGILRRLDAMAESGELQRLASRIGTAIAGAIEFAARGVEMLARVLDAIDRAGPGAQAAAQIAGIGTAALIALGQVNKLLVGLGLIKGMGPIGIAISLVIIGTLIHRQQIDAVREKMRAAAQQAVAEGLRGAAAEAAVLRALSPGDRGAFIRHTQAILEARQQVDRALQTYGTRREAEARGRAKAALEAASATEQEAAANSKLQAILDAMNKSLAGVTGRAAGGRGEDVWAKRFGLAMDFVRHEREMGRMSAAEEIRVLQTRVRAYAQHIADKEDRARALMAVEASVHAATQEIAEKRLAQADAFIAHERAMNRMGIDEAIRATQRKLAIAGLEPEQRKAIVREIETLERDRAAERLRISEEFIAHETAMGRMSLEDQIAAKRRELQIDGLAADQKKKIMREIELLQRQIQERDRANALALLDYEIRVTGQGFERKIAFLEEELRRKKGNAAEEIRVQNDIAAAYEAWGQSVIAKANEVAQTNREAAVAMLEAWIASVQATHPEFAKLVDDARKAIAQIKGELVGLPNTLAAAVRKAGQDIAQGANQWLGYVQGFAQDARSALAGGLFDVMEGRLKGLTSIWQGVLQAIERQIANWIASAAVQAFLNLLSQYVLPALGLAGGGSVGGGGGAVFDFARGGVVQAASGLVARRPTLIQIAERPPMTEIVQPLPAGMSPRDLSEVYDVIRGRRAPRGAFEASPEGPGLLLAPVMVSAMDSRSFRDRADDIADAIFVAMQRNPALARLIARAARR